MTDFNDRIAVVTGAAGNVGSAMSRAFAARGATLALIDRSQESIDGALAALPAGANAKGYACDLTDAGAVAATYSLIQQQQGGIDMVANIAGGFTMGPATQDTPDSDWDHMLTLNLRTVVNSCRAAIPIMLTRGGGRIVNVSARAAAEGQANMGPYCASKAAVITLTETLAAENRDSGITANCILPGTVDTPQNRAAMPDADHDSWVPPEALADVILFLCSDQGRFISGAAVPVYGRS